MLYLFPVQYDGTSQVLTYHSSISVTVSAVATTGDANTQIRDVASDVERVAMMVEQRLAAGRLSRRLECRAESGVLARMDRMNM